MAINSSLMTLGRCLEALRWNQQHRDKGPAALRVVPYRQSKVTHLFRDALHGWGQVLLSVNVSPVARDYDETAHVLKVGWGGATSACACWPCLAAPLTLLAPPITAPSKLLLILGTAAGTAAETVAAAAPFPPAVRGAGHADRDHPAGGGAAPHHQGGVSGHQEGQAQGRPAARSTPPDQVSLSLWLWLTRCGCGVYVNGVAQCLAAAWATWEAWAQAGALVGARLCGLCVRGGQIVTGRARGPPSLGDSMHCTLQLVGAVLLQGQKEQGRGRGCSSSSRGWRGAGPGAPPGRGPSQSRGPG